MIGSGEGRNHDRQNIIFDQRNCNHQAEGRFQVAHGGSVGTTAFIERGQRIHVKNAKTDIGKGDHSRTDIAPFLQTIGPQDTHQFAGAIKVGSKEICAKQGQGSQHGNLSGAVNLGLILLFARRNAQSDRDNDDKNSY